MSQNFQDALILTLYLKKNLEILDLFLLTDGDIHSAITTDDFKMALEGFTPAALREVCLHTAGELGWSDVGGLAAVKGALMETLLWPTKVWLTA